MTDTRKSDELKPCPNLWCKATEPPTVHNGTLRVGADVRCVTCEIYGPWMPDRDQAVTAWNTRPALGVTVKPLVWEKWELTGNLCDGYRWLERSLTRNGNFFLNQRLSDGMFVVTYDLQREPQHYADTADLVKHRAFLEHERRILPHITPTAGTMRCAECDCDHGGTDCNWIKPGELAVDYWRGHKAGKAEWDNDPRMLGSAARLEDNLEISSISRNDALREAAEICEVYATLMADMALEGGESARLRESMEATATKLKIRILALIEAPTGWQPIETAPSTYGPDILIYGPECGVNQSVYVCGEFVDCVEEYTVYQPTHWMPLPTPPEDKP